MADSTIDSELITLVDNWPGAPITVNWTPGRTPALGAFTGSDYHNVATPKFEIGRKATVYCAGTTGKAGWSTLIYLQVGTQNADSVIAAKSVVVQDSATVWYQVTNDPDSCIKIPTGLAAIALSAMTDAYYGWFWCGGVCPEQYITALGGNYATEGNLVAGAFCAMDLAADYVGLGPAVETNATLTRDVLGYAIAADA